MRRTACAGLTTIEIVITMAIFSVISVATMGLVFASLALRDQTLAVTETQESLRVFDHSLRWASQESFEVTGGGTSLFFSSPTQCWSFVYDALGQNVFYDHIISASCTPNPSPSVNFFPSTQQITALTFSITSLATGGRAITANGVILTALPFGSDQTSFANTFTNLID